MNFGVDTALLGSDFKPGLIGSTDVAIKSVRRYATNEQWHLSYSRDSAVLLVWLFTPGVCLYELYAPDVNRKLNC
jgi:hypothetical protein